MLAKVAYCARLQQPDAFSPDEKKALAACGPGLKNLCKKLANHAVHGRLPGYGWTLAPGILPALAARRLAVHVTKMYAVMPLLYPVAIGTDGADTALNRLRAGVKLWDGWDNEAGPFTDDMIFRLIADRSNIVIVYGTDQPPDESQRTALRQLMAFVPAQLPMLIALYANHRQRGEYETAAPVLSPLQQL